MNYYEILNIERNADTSAIKRAYFSAVKIHSPDKDPEGFKAIRLAYETLCDQKKRSEYDSYFVLTGEMQNKLLAAREMIRENRYKQAADFLTGLIETNSDSEKQLSLFPPEHPENFYAETKRLLAEVLWYMKKNGEAKKICEELLKKNPSDAETLLLLAEIAAAAGHKEKAAMYFNEAANAAPLNARIWSAYMYYTLDHAHNRVHIIFKRAMKHDINMFRDDYILYLIVLSKEKKFSDKKYLQYCDKFAEYFLLDKNHDEKVYENLLNFISHIIDKEENIPFLKKILPVLENSRHRKDNDKEIFEAIRTTFIIHKLKSDKRIHEVLIDMTIFFLTENTDKDELLGMECFIVSELSDLRPSIKVLKNEYLDFFKLNQAFYLDVLNEKKETYLIDKYIGKFKKLKSSSKNDLNDDFDERNELTQVIRSSPKIGRNDPCPCGSGKKHKKCCGR